MKRFRTKVMMLCATFVHQSCNERSFTATESSGHQSRNPLSVPYLCQYENRSSVNPGGSSANTSLAMILQYYGVDSTLDAIYNSFGNIPSLEILKLAATRYKLKTAIARTASVSSMKQELDAGRPFILAADFSEMNGHFVVVTGYNSTGFFVNDPAGVWNQSTFSPQSSYSPKELCSTGNRGEKQLYSFRSIVKAFDKGHGTDGTGWVLFLQKPEQQ